MSYVVGIKNNQVVISRGLEMHLTPVASIAEYYAYFANEAARLGVNIEQLQIYNSSTMDFPHDSTSDPATLALVAEITATKAAVRAYKGSYYWQNAKVNNKEDAANEMIADCLALRENQPDLPSVQPETWNANFDALTQLIHRGRIAPFLMK